MVCNTRMGSFYYVHSHLSNANNLALTGLNEGYICRYYRYFIVDCSREIAILIPPLANIGYTTLIRKSSLFDS